MIKKMQASDHISAHPESETESHSPEWRDEARAHDHLGLDGTFWLETEGAQLARWFATAPKSRVSSEIGGWLALSGEPWVGFNVGCVLHSPGATTLFSQYVEGIGGLPGVLIVEKITPEVLELAERVGARHLGELPLMLFDEESAPVTTIPMDVRAITTLADLTPTAVLVAASFSMNLQACLDLFEPMLEDPHAAIWVAEKDGHIVSAVLSMRTGGLVGLHYPVTSIEHRGQGVAGSLVRHVMAHEMSRDTRRFFLHTTGRGRRFAEGIGYRPAGLPHGFVVNSDPTSAFSTL